jgi:hypothetical protein
LRLLAPRHLPQSGHILIASARNQFRSVSMGPGRPLMRAGRLLRRGLPSSSVLKWAAVGKPFRDDGHLVWVWLDWPVACAPFPGRMRPRRGRGKIYAAVFGIGVPRSDKARQPVPSMLSLTQGAFEEISDALQVGLLGWPRLYRRRMCFPFYRFSVYPAEGQKSNRRAGTAPRMATSGGVTLSGLLAIGGPQMIAQFCGLVVPKRCAPSPIRTLR